MPDDEEEAEAEAAAAADEDDAESERRREAGPVAVVGGGEEDSTGSAAIEEEILFRWTLLLAFRAVFNLLANPSRLEVSSSSSEWCEWIEVESAAEDEMREAVAVEGERSWASSDGSSRDDSLGITPLALRSDQRGVYRASTGESAPFGRQFAHLLIKDSTQVQTYSETIPACACSSVPPYPMHCSLPAFPPTD